MCSKTRALTLLACLAWCSTGAASCSRTPDEPEPSTTADTADTADQRKKTLRWTVPAGWVTERTANRGPYRAKYRVPQIGDDKLNAEVLVTYLGKGKKARLDSHFTEWFGEFDGDPAKTAARQDFVVGAIKVRTAEVAGTYKYAMGPKMGPKKRHAAHIIKRGWRGIAAGIKTPRRGNWWFKLVGPDDTVAAAKPAFFQLLRSVR